LLDRYRERVLSFNDDIQGTAAVALAGVMAASRASSTPMRQQRVVIVGAGAAGIGIARLLRDALARAGLEGADRTRAIVVLDSRGPLIERDSWRDDYKRALAWPAALAEAVGLRADDDLQSVVEKLKPTALIGTSGQPDVFTESIVRAMAASCERPAIFPYSNPTSKSEARPVDLVRWTDGRALVATGSPFDPVDHGGRRFRIGQGNNVFIFPGIGLGALVAGARRVVDSMFTVAADSLATFVDEADLAEGALYPPLRELRDVTTAIATEVAVEAGKTGVAAPLTRDQARDRVAAAMWYPDYPELRAV
jgi:malate dehydrogenase (oxaloacetate-decarboxylating)